MPRRHGPKPKEQFTVEEVGEGIVVWRSRDRKALAVRFFRVWFRGHNRRNLTLLVRLDR